jgi:hypothetical protein
MHVVSIVTENFQVPKQLILKLTFRLDAERSLRFDDEVDADYLEAELQEMYTDLQQEEDQLPASFTELLLGDWDGFDMANAIFNDINMQIAQAQIGQNSAQLVRPIQAFSVSSLVDELRAQHSAFR